MPTSGRKYRLWIVTSCVAVADLSLTVMGLSYAISALMAPRDRLVSLYRDFHTDYVTDFGSRLSRHLTYHLSWMLPVAVPLLMARWACIHLLAYAALTESELWTTPYLAWNLMCVVATLAALVTFPVLHSVEDLTAEEYMDFHHVWLYLLIFFAVLQVTYEVAVLAHFRQLHARSMARRQRIVPLDKDAVAPNDDGQETDETEEGSADAGVVGSTEDGDDKGEDRSEGGRSEEHAYESVADSSEQNASEKATTETPGRRR